MERYRIFFSLFFLVITGQLFAWNSPNLVSPSNNSTTVHTAVTLDWNAVSGSEGYVVELDTVSTFNSPYLQSVTKIYINSSSSNSDTKEYFNNLYFGKTYYWRVKAYVTGSSSNWSTRQFTTRNAVPLNSPSNGSTTVHTGVTLDWSSSYGVAFYEVELDTTSSFNSTFKKYKLDTYVSSSSINSDTEEYFDNLFFGKVHYWRVRAINDVDTSDWTVRQFTTRNTVSLNTPSNGSTTVYTGVTLNWSSSYGVDFYEVELDTTSNFNSTFKKYKLETYINSSSINNDTEEYFDNLFFGKVHYWRVRAINDVDTSDWAIRQFTTRSTVSLNSPTNGSMTIHTGVTLNWLSSYGVDFYEVELDTTSNFNSAFKKYKLETYINSSSANNDTEEYFDNLFFGKVHYWRVRAINDVDTSDWAIRQFTTKNTVDLMSPSDMAVNRNVAGINLDWSSSYGVDFYEVEWDTTAYFNSPIYQTVTKTYINASSANSDTKQATGTLLNNQTYFWRVRALNAVDTSTWNSRIFSTGSVIQSLFPPVLIAPANNATNIGTSTNLSWNSVNGANSYVVEYANNTAFSSAISFTTSNLTYTINGLSANTTYYWRAKAVGTQGSSNWSTVWQFNTGTGACNSPDLPVLSVSNSSICPNDNVVISVQSGNLNDATNWVLYSNSCGGTVLTSNTNGVFTVSPTSTTSYFIRGEGGCVTVGSCSSVTVTVNNDYHLNETVTICKGEDYTFPDGVVLTNIQSAVSHISNLQTTSTCDSVITTNLVVNVVDVTTSTQNATITANLSNAQYQWMDCATNQIIQGETNMSFTTPVSGDFAVIITSNNCTDTSNCVNISIPTTISETETANEWSVYPNPAHNQLMIKGKNYETVQITDLQGRVIKTIRFQNVIAISELDAGIYILSVLDKKGELKQVVRFIKE